MSEQTEERASGDGDGRGSEVMVDGWVVDDWDVGGGAERRREGGRAGGQWYGGGVCVCTE